jgi:outer membrane protein assembly factor BamD (BamD/ComL family)
LIDSTQAIAAPPMPMAVAITAKSRKIARSKERATSAESTRTTNGTDLREEIRLLDLARTAVRSRQSEGALVSLNAYATRFADGAFKQEASVLRIQAVAQQGDMGRASTMAKRFVESNPNSPYVSRAARIAKGSSVSEPSR